MTYQPRVTGDQLTQLDAEMERSDTGRYLEAAFADLDRAQRAIKREQRLAELDAEWHHPSDGRGQ